MPIEPYSDHQRVAFRRVRDPNDPLRCEGNTAHGQCKFYAEPGKKLCQMHSRGPNRDNELQHYRLSKFRARERAGQIANSSKILGLRDEIGLARVLLEERLEMIESTNDYLIHGQTVERLLDKIKDLIQVFHNIQQKSGAFLDPTQVKELADSIVTILSNHISDNDLLATIAAEIAELFPTD